MKKLVLSAIAALMLFATVAATGKVLHNMDDPPPDCGILGCGNGN